MATTTITCGSGAYCPIVACIKKATANCSGEVSGIATIPTTYFIGDRAIVVNMIVEQSQSNEIDTMTDIVVNDTVQDPVDGCDKNKFIPICIDEDSGSNWNVRAGASIVNLDGVEFIYDFTKNNESSTLALIKSMTSCMFIYFQEGINEWRVVGHSGGKIRIVEDDNKTRAEFNTTDGNIKFSVEGTTDTYVRLFVNESDAETDQLVKSISHDCSETVTVVC